MCIILDNNIRDEVFGRNKTPVGKAVWQWINGTSGKRIRVVTGGRLTPELSEYSAAKVG